MSALPFNYALKDNIRTAYTLTERFSSMCEDSWEWSFNAVFSFKPKTLKEKVKYKKWKQIDLYRSTKRLQSMKYDKVTLAVFASNDGFVFCSSLTTCHDSSPKCSQFFNPCDQKTATLRTFKSGITVQILDYVPKITACNSPQFLLGDFNTYEVPCTKYPNFSAQSGSKFFGLPIFMLH